jgi:CheY-like chemotaxis protein
MSEKAVNGKNNSVLLIDDEPYILEILSSELTLLGIKHLTASNGVTALELIEKEKPAVIVTDYKMPGLDGIQLLQFLRNLNINVPVICITGNADEETVREAWRLGVFHLFQKPFDAEAVAKKINQALKIEPELWLQLAPNFLLEVSVNKNFQKLTIEMEKDLYNLIKERCIREAISFNGFVNNLLRQAVK